MQLHPGNPSWPIEEVNNLLLKYSVIGMGEEWDNDRGAPNRFRHDAHKGDIVIIRHQSKPRYLVEIIGECTKNEGNNKIDVWFDIYRKVKILSNGYFKHPTNPTPVFYDEHVVGNESIAIFPTDNTKPVDFIIYGYDSYSPTGDSDKTSLICYNPIDSLIGYTNLKYLNISVFDDVVYFNDFLEKELTLDNIVSFKGTKVNYKNTTLSDLGKLINATVINISDSELGGSIESLVEVFRSLGRTAPVTDFNFYGSNITYEGSPIGNMGGHYTLSWTENTISLIKNN
jgi:hypothetical protein